MQGNTLRKRTSAVKASPRGMTRFSSMSAVSPQSSGLEPPDEPWTTGSPITARKTLGRRGTERLLQRKDSSPQDELIERLTQVNRSFNTISEAFEVLGEVSSAVENGLIETCERIKKPLVTLRAKVLQHVARSKDTPLNTEKPGFKLESSRANVLDHKSQLSIERYVVRLYRAHVGRVSAIDFDAEILLTDDADKEERAEFITLLSHVHKKIGDEGVAQVIQTMASRMHALGDFMGLQNLLYITEDQEMLMSVICPKTRPFDVGVKPSAARMDQVTQGLKPILPLSDFMRYTNVGALAGESVAGDAYAETMRGGQLKLGVTLQLSSEGAKEILATVES